MLALLILAIIALEIIRVKAYQDEEDEDQTYW